MNVRNIFIWENNILGFRGNEIVFYTGNLYLNAKQLKNFSSLYDKNKDLLINCNECAKSKYKKFIKK